MKKQFFLLRIITAILSSFVITIGIGILLVTIFIYKPTNFMSVLIPVSSGVIIIMMGLLPILEVLEINERRKNENEK